MTNVSSRFLVFTDGACSGNPGPGGWGAVILEEERNQITEIGGYEEKTTNNRMELLSTIRSLEYILEKIKTLSAKVTLCSDSAYVLNGITSWVHNWKRNNWKTSDKKPVMNQDLWMILDSLNRDARLQTEWKKVKGHSNCIGNNRADEIAVSYSLSKEISLFVDQNALDYPFDIRLLA